MRFLPGFNGHRPAKKRILLVDDDPGFTKLTRLNLERTDRYVIREENDATHALQAAVEFKPDLVLLDLVMPKNDGARVGRQINGDPRLRETRIVILSGCITKSKEGFDFPAFAKPIGVEGLVEVIEANLSHPDGPTTGM
jgi:two-component system alkaline phosphatase synthesis response regulator PhoP